MTLTATGGSVPPKSSNNFPLRKRRSDLLQKSYPTLRIEDIEAIIEEIDVDKDGKIDIDEFIGFMHTSVNKLQMNQDSRQYRAVLALKAQRKFSPNEFLNYFDKLSSSFRYAGSFTSAQHERRHNLPSEPFRLLRDPHHMGYVDLHPILGPDGKPTYALQEIVPTVTGSITVKTAAGLQALESAEVVDHVVRVCFFNRKQKRLVGGTAFVAAECDSASPDVWTFKRTKGVASTNPVVYKWTDKATLADIDLLFELVVALK